MIFFQYFFKISALPVGVPPPAHYVAHIESQQECHLLAHPAQIVPEVVYQFVNGFPSNRNPVHINLYYKTQTHSEWTLVN